MARTGIDGPQQPAGPVLHHVSLKTIRLDEMIEWYGRVVGMRVIHRLAGIVLMTNDGANHRLALLTSKRFGDDTSRLRHVGMHHIAFEFTTVDGLLGTYERIERDHGYRPHMAIDHGITLSLYFLDPDGNSVELQVDTHADWAASTRFMVSSPQFASEPIGTFCDPEALLAAWRAGADLEELHRRAYAGEFPPTTEPDLRAEL
jgi:catechol 2,3-dioxygenase